MNQFDVFAFDDISAISAVVVMQGSFYLDLPTVLVAPLFLSGSPLRYEIINPEVHLNGIDYIVKLEQMAAISKRRLAEELGSISGSAPLIQTALDRLIAGY